MKVLDKLRPPKYNSTEPEEYLKLPEDDDDEKFPIGVSDESSEESEDEDGSGFENYIPGDENSVENQSNADSLENNLETIEENENSIKSQKSASGEESDD